MPQTCIACMPTPLYTLKQHCIKKKHFYHGQHPSPPFCVQQNSYIVPRHGQHIDKHPFWLTPNVKKGNDENQKLTIIWQHAQMYMAPM